MPTGGGTGGASGGSQWQAINESAAHLAQDHPDVRRALQKTTRLERELSGRPFNTALQELTTRARAELSRATTAVKR